MGNIGSHTSQINGSRLEGLRVPQQAIRTFPKTGSQIKVLPDPESRQRLRHTNNGDILQSGGTLTGRRHIPFRNASSKSYLATHRYSLDKNDTRSIALQSRQYSSSHGRLNSQVKSYKSEPDLRLPPSTGREMKENRTKKKYKAPAPPCKKREEKSPSWSGEPSDEYQPRRARLFKTRVETKKESSHINAIEQMADTNSDVVEETILANQNTTHYAKPNRLSVPEFNNLIESEEFKKELKQATDRLKQSIEATQEKTKAVDNLAKHIFDSPNEITKLLSLAEQDSDIEKRFIRGEPSGKESSTPELSPDLRASDNQKPREFYFGMEKEDSDISSSYNPEEDEENSTIALRLRPVLPRKPPQIPQFSPAAAWRLLDARSQDSGISGDARPPLSSSWTPQQDLEDDSSLEEIRREVPRSLPKHRPHIFSLSLPRDLQPTTFTTISCHKNNVSSLRRLKRSVSGVLNTLSSKKELDQRVISKDNNDANWFLSRSAPNSINDNSPENSEIPFSNITPSARLMYLPENTARAPLNEIQKNQLSVYSKSCEELKMPESLRDPKSMLDFPLNKEEPSRKQKKFTFQSTVRQIERRKMAERLSKEAEKKEKQRLRELEAMKKVEEEFQRKRAKEKANIRHQLRLYAMDESQWTSLPFELNDNKLEERQEPDGAFSSTASSPMPTSKYQIANRNSSSLEAKRITQATQELSEYRQVQRDYKEYRGLSKFGTEHRVFKQTTVHPEVTCNMPNAQGSSHEQGNYRKEFAFGMKTSKSIDSNHSDDSSKIYRNKFSPITRF